MNPTAKILIVIGFVFIAVGLIWHFSGGSLPLGKLPGDIRIEKGNTRFYFPITSSILVSILFSLIVFLIKKFKS